jgi:hypothetical protein
MPRFGLLQHGHISRRNWIQNDPEEFMMPPKDGSEVICSQFRPFKLALRIRVSPTFNSQDSALVNSIHYTSRRFQVLHKQAFHNYMRLINRESIQADGTLYLDCKQKSKKSAQTPIQPYQLN